MQKLLLKLNQDGFINLCYKKWMVQLEHLHHAQPRQCGTKVERGRCGAVSIWAKAATVAF